MKELKFLYDQKVSDKLIDELIKFRMKYEVDKNVEQRIPVPSIPFFGKEILEMAISALLQGENLLLSGGKATGKNVLAENLAYVFGRPSYNISFHVNTDSSSLIGTDTFQENEVRLRKGPVYQCAEQGGFCIFDEINMAKNDAVSVLHSTLDYRRMIDIPGYERLVLHEATRFIGTMNYGYVGTRELNEALVSRFLVIDMPALNEETIMTIFQRIFSEAKIEALQQFCGLFLDLQTKAFHGELSSKPLDLRGMISSLRTVHSGLAPSLAIRMGVTNKSFDSFERDMIQDIVSTRIPKDWKCKDVFCE